MFGTPFNRLVAKLENKRTRSNELLARVSAYGDSERNFLDVVLIQEFVLECVSSLKRFVLGFYFFEFEDIPPERVSTCS
jgi:hypothetical protein